MAGFSTKVYVVQRANGEVVGVKLSFGSAHALAKAQAPARVLFAVADKSPEPNVSVHDSDQSECNQLHTEK